jgi:hypothetical protein
MELERNGQVALTLGRPRLLEGKNWWAVIEGKNCFSEVLDY